MEPNPNNEKLFNVPVEEARYQSSPTSQPATGYNSNNVSQPQQNLVYKYAGFIKRLEAAIIDAFAVMIIFIPFAFIAPQIISKSNEGFLSSLGALLYIFYEVFFTYKWGGSLGKLAVKIKVVNEKFERASLWQVIVRQTIGQFISAVFINLGYIWVAIDSKKQAWHDKLAKTFVVYSNPIVADLKEANEKLDTSQGLKPLSNLLLISALIEGAVFSLMAFFVSPSLTSITKEFTKDSGSFVRYLPYLVLLISFVQVVYSLLLRSQAKNPSTQPKSIKTLAKVLFVGGLILFFLGLRSYLMYSLGPIYNLVEDRNKIIPTSSLSLPSKVLSPTKTHGQTFVNSSYGYSFGYPPSTEVESYSSSEPDPKTSSSIIVKDKNSFKYLTISVVKKDPVQTLKDYVNEEIAKNNEANKNSSNYRPLTIFKEGFVGGKEAMYVSNAMSESNLMLSIYVTKEPETVFFIRLGPIFQGQEDAYVDYFYSIVNSIKFTSNSQ